MGKVPNVYIFILSIFSESYVILFILDRMDETQETDPDETQRTEEVAAPPHPDETQQTEELAAAAPPHPDQTQYPEDHP